VASRDRRHCDVRCVMTLDVLWRGVTRALRHPDIRIKPSPGGGVDVMIANFGNFLQIFLTIISKANVMFIFPA
jgi:hypothetical protein